jgi:hypothetical protein
VKFVHYALAAGAVLSLTDCTVAPLPTAPTAVTTVDAAKLEDGFEPAFYRAFLQNGFESPQQLEAVRLLRSTFRIYMRTEDDGGRAMDAATLDATERALIDSAPIWSGETYRIAQVVRGPGSRERFNGWITVRWSTAADNGRCGRSTVGVDGGFIELNVSGECSCGMATRVYPRVVRHELGHAMGYYHTDNTHDVMYGQAITSDACDILPSDRERRHAIIAHRQSP